LFVAAFHGDRRFLLTDRSGRLVSAGIARQKIEATHLSFVHPDDRSVPASAGLFFPRQNKRLFRSPLHELAEQRLLHRSHRRSPCAVKRNTSIYLTTNRIAGTHSSKT
jgi:hypothetical protein